MLKKALSLMLGMLLLLFVTMVSAADFSDMTSSYSWAEEAVNTLAENGIINGYPDGTFKPGNNITKEEAISLFARALGSSETLNDSVVSLANVLYEDALDSYDTYAKEAAAYLLYKKVLSEDELSDYISSSNKSQPLKRYEAAILIAKCLGGEVWLKSNPDITLSYADASSVPAAAKGYVYFASEAKIIQGMEDNKFVPMGNVTRAQIATMIHRIFERMSYSYAKGVISQINTTSNTIVLRANDDSTESYLINKNVAVMLDGVQSQLASLSVGQEAIVTFSNDALYSIDVVEHAVDDEIEAVYKGKSTGSTGTTIKINPMDSEETISYPLADDVIITYDNASASISSLSVGDHLQVTIKGGKIVVIEAEAKTKQVTGASVVSISFDPDVLITVRTEDGDVVDYSIRSGAIIRKNGSLTDFSELAIGDKVDLTLEYDQISAVVAIGTSKKITGQIEEITISKKTSSLVINTGSSSTSYTVSQGVEVTLDGAAATLYDLRLGYTVEIETSSSTVKAIKVKSVAAPMQITGQITLVNTAYDMIRVSYADYNGNMQDATVFIKSSAKILDSNDGKIKTISQLKIGQNVTVAGSENVGVFEANSIMILSNK
ncbi:MAG: S-layer homology domain-containing protein [Clostridia bacterium]|nr:S-layer homology domain-containing protein [Clostridia bacterium]